ncbi:MAG: M81 family metallopeptidase [Clostridiales Family XIII bacterium]|nr:M81 family metallopeptidase [Clostridia bacterium]MDY3012675.1 M81 family metallopeptidase [Clostridiales Family XIII bacterium]
MKIAIGTFLHESHSFSNDITDIEIMKRNLFQDKKELIDQQRGTRGCAGFLGGYVDYAEEHGWEIVPLFAASALPAGPVTRETYEHVKDKILTNLEGHQVDGVLLHLHGAAVVQGIDDAEGDLLSAIRELVGEETAIMTILDLHANVSDLMVEKADAVYGYDTYPHEDSYEREQEVCRLLEKVTAKKVVPTSYRAQPPLVVPSVYTTTNEGPMKALMEKAVEWEKEEDVVNVAVFAGFYGSEKRETGPSCVVITNDNPQLAEKVAKDVVDYMWEIRDQFFIEMTPVDEAIKKVKENEGLWAFIDECDDPMGGGTGDGTYLLKKILESGITPGGVSTIRDAEIVKEAMRVGVGGRVKGLLGGKTDDQHGEPIEIDAEVIGLKTDKVPREYYDLDTLQDVGGIAVLDQDGILIIVTELKANSENIILFHYLDLDLDISRMRIVLLKGSGKAYEQAYGNIPAGYITPESYGITNPDVTRIGEFKKLRRPIVPFDENVPLRYK